MISKIFFAALMLLVQSIAALNILNVPTGTIWAPCGSYPVVLDGNGVGPGANVRVELWDNQDGLDVETAVLAESALVDKNGAVTITVPCDYAKTKNAFLRVYYRGYNAVSGRIYIRNNDINSKTCVKPTATPTPTIIPTIVPTMTPTCNGAPMPMMPMPGVPLNTASMIYPGPGAVIHAAPGAVIYSSSNGTSTMTMSTNSTTVAPVKTSSRTAISSTSTSSATTAKHSFGSIALTLAIALSVLLF